MVFSAFGRRNSGGISLLVGSSLDAVINLVFIGDWSRLVVTDVAFEFRVAGVDAPNSPGERRSFFRQLGPFLDDSKRTVLMGDWKQPDRFAGRVRFGR